ncbi:MAG TPA: hypothetical protein VFW73_02145, partial [Lacipirellulaceae bacterium]|nr:hypothetical protein [Lacipirellulaceae bacterium]
LAILGTDTDILSLASAARNAQHEIVWIGNVRDEDAAAIAQVRDRTPDRSTEWELLLDRGIVDAVLIGRGTASNDLRVEQIKRLVAEGIPLVVVHPAFDSVLPYYEIDMVRRESGAILQHYNPLVGHPLIPAMAEWMRNGHPTIGTIHQLSCERRVAAATRELVLAHFARDVELLAAVAGSIGRVTAIGPSVDAESFASLQMQMTTGGSASMRWSVGYAATGSQGLQMSLLGESGTVNIHIADGNHPRPPIWQLETADKGETTDEPLDSYDSARAAIVRLSDAVGAPQTEQRASASTWETATRAMEVVDAAELSLQKGRTIEVYQQQLTERLAFRGTMAAMGCGLMLVAFVAVIVVAILGGAEGVVRRRLLPSWPLMMLAVLAFFLLLQAVPLLARKPNHDGTSSQNNPPDESDA